MRKYIHYFDRIVIKQVLRLPSWARPVMLFATLLGQPPITVGLATGIIGFAIARENSLFLWLGIVAIVTFAASSIMKIWLRRDRPDNEYVRNMIIHTFSFPSGHAAGSVASFSLLVYVAAAMYPPATIVVLVGVVVACLLIGVSRVYLGAHYPSDVVGGWIVGGIGVTVMIAITIESSL